MNKDATILVVGHNDAGEMALADYLAANHFTRVFSSSARALNTTIQAAVYDFFSRQKPEYVFLSGDIGAGLKLTGELVYQRLETQNNIVYASCKFGARKLLFLVAPEHRRTVTDVAGIELCRGYRQQYGFSAIAAAPVTILGPGPGLPADTEAQWPPGARDEFLCADDFAGACLLLMERYDGEEIIRIKNGDNRLTAMGWRAKDQHKGAPA